MIRQLNLALQTAISCSIIFASRSLAAVDTEGGGGQDVVIDPPFSGTIIDVLDRIIGFLVVVAIPIATIMVLYGAFQMLTAGASSADQFKNGVKTITYAAIGFAVVLIGRGIIFLVKQLITGG